ncbi:hypothetical protein VNI00_001267 [Paramarasmius palmivorus]|uniref:Uncharacterized protein n=1 Tax=Paramarasmius palmivorus TaxID=297713 RepID=A0AAW0E970_9AGAR
MTRHSIEVEIVEDSEPEREALRRELKSRQSTPSSMSLANGTQQASKEVGGVDEVNEISVLEISDDSISAPPAKARQRTPEVMSIIDISSSSISSASIPSPPKPALSTREPLIRATAGTEEEELPSDDELRPLSLSKFAFNAPKKPGGLPNSTTSSRSYTTLSRNASVKSIPETKGPKKGPRCVTHQFADQFSDEQFSRLLKCVVCDIRWTVRKSTSQKVSHIRSCAKKNSFQEDSVCRLIRKELEKTPPDKGKGKAPDETPAETIFSEIVHDAAPKKRTKRQEVATSIKTLSETRNAILDKAKIVFAQNTHAFHARQNERALHSIDDPTSTPEFGKSGLARIKGRKQSMFQYPPSPGQPSHNEPAFPTLRPLRRSTSPPVLCTSDIPNVETTTPKKPNTKPPAPVVYLSSSSSDDSQAPSKAPTKSPRRPPFPPQATPLADELYDEQVTEPFHNKDAYLHYEPNMYTHSSIEQPEDAFHSDNTPIIPHTRTTTPTAGPSTKPITPKKRRRRVDKAKPFDPEVQFGDTWEQRIKSEILADTELHLQILRYEPLPFKRFLQIATSDSTLLASGKLKLHLKQFLDKQAINFYDEETVGRGKRH